IETLAVSENLGRCSERQLLEYERIEDRLKSVEVALADRIEHMIVAFGAPSGQAHECCGDCFGGREGELGRILGVAVNVTAREEAQRKQVFGSRLHTRACAELVYFDALARPIPRKLGAYKLVVR